MKYSLTQQLSTLQNECLVLGVFSDGHFSKDISEIPPALHAVLPVLIPQLLKNKTFIWHTAKEGQTLLLAYCQESSKFTGNALSKLISNLTEQLNKQAISSATLCLPQVIDHTPDWQIEHMIIDIEQRHSQFFEYKSKDTTKNSLDAVTFYLKHASSTAIAAGSAIASGIHLTRTLANAPANHCTPNEMANQAHALAKEFETIRTHVLERPDIEALGMGAFLAVAQGSHEPLKFIEIHYQGTPSSQDPVVLIGKGITFDSGGISIKPADGMNEMKYDMSGAASVLGTLKACALLKLPIHVIGLMPCTENMPGGGAVKPGDIVTSLSKQTVEIINTDAEGRLILADALTYAERFHPKFVLDIATLTGAVIIALGHVASGYMSNDDTLATLLEQAAKNSNDRIWRLPLDDDYQDALTSPLADMVNSPFDRVAGSVTAACFLSRFTHAFRWAHLDIAGTAWNSGKNNQATGRPVPLLTQLLRDIAHAS